MGLMYCICGNFGGDFNLVIFTLSLNLMYANTSISQAIYIDIVLFTKLNVCQFAFTFKSAKLSVCQIHRVYGTQYIW